MFKSIYYINLGSTVMISLFYLTFYGLALMSVLGAIQIVMSIVLTFKINDFTKKIRSHYQLHSILAVITIFIIGLLTLEIITRQYRIHGFIVVIISGGALSFYHLWITKQLKEKEVNHV